MTHIGGGYAPTKLKHAQCNRCGAHYQVQSTREAAGMNCYNGATNCPGQLEVLFTGALLFGKLDEWVLLIRKTHPEWQAGKLNLIGGHVEQGEAIGTANHREFREETGLSTDIAAWQRAVEVYGPGWRMFVYRSSTQRLHAPQAQGDFAGETVDWHYIKTLGDDLIPNVRWLLEMCRNVHHPFWPYRVEENRPQ